MHKNVQEKRFPVFKDLLKQFFNQQPPYHTLDGRAGDPPFTFWYSARISFSFWMSSFHFLSSSSKSRSSLKRTEKHNPNSLLAQRL